MSFAATAVSVGAAAAGSIASGAMASGGGSSGGASANTGTFANNLSTNTAFKNFLPTNYWG